MFYKLYSVTKCYSVCGFWLFGVGASGVSCSSFALPSRALLFIVLSGNITARDPMKVNLKIKPKISNKTIIQYNKKKTCVWKKTGKTSKI